MERERIEKGRRIMRSFKLNELSAVDRPAQAHARKTLMKRDSSAEVEKIVGFMKAYLDPCEGARPFVDFVSASADQDKYWRAMSVASDQLSGLDSSLRSIIGDRNMVSADKESAMRNSVEDFLASIRGKMPEVEDALMKVIPDDPTELDKLAKGARSMAREQITIEDLQKKFDDEVAKSVKLVADLETTKNDLKTATAALTKSTADIEALKAEAEKAKSKMPADEEEYAASMKDDKAQKAFREMAPEARKAAMAKAKADDEVLKVEGVGEIRKSVVGEAQFALFKAQQVQNETIRKDLDAERDLRKRAELTKSVETGFMKDFTGKTDDKVDVLKAIESITDEKVRKNLTDMLETGAKAVKAAFTTLGHGGQGSLDPDVKKAADDFMAKVTEIKRAEKCSHMEAMQKAQKEHPALFKAYQGEGPATN
jgi:myosin heavy subunit